MSKINLGVIFGGMSTEHEVSMASGQSIIENLDESKYNIFPIYIDKNGNWYEYKVIEDSIDNTNINIKLYNRMEINNITRYLKKLDIVFPVLHGIYGEDGSIQGMLQMLKIPYVGCGILSSSIAMDKAYTKIILKNAEINQAKFCYLKKIKDKYICITENFEEKEVSNEEINNIVEKKLKYPVFIKPANSGSSIGISKAENEEELIKGIEEAVKYDEKILIEENIIGKEIECSVLGSVENLIASCTGQIIPSDEFYTYEAKYRNENSQIVIPSGIKCENEVQKIAIKAFKAIDAKGLARVDFFVTEKNEIYLNEINTIPGFTNISMYPKLWQTSGIKYSDLLDKLIQLVEF